MPLPSKELSESALDALITRERTRVVAPLTEWRTLAAQLRDEGMLRTAGSYTSEQSFVSYPETPTPRFGIFRWGFRMVAGAALMGTGILIGRTATIGSEVIPAVKQMVSEHIVDSVAADGTFASADQARAVLVRSQTRFQQAAAYLSAHNTDSAAPVQIEPAEYQERLRALDQMMAVTQLALKVAPGDPVLNQYYISAFGARQATVQRLDEALPVGARLARF